MAGERYTQEFKIAAVKQITQEGHSIPDVARRLGITTKSLYNWRTSHVLLIFIAQTAMKKRCY